MLHAIQLQVNFMSYLEKRRQLYYAILTIPVKAREALGKRRYLKSTGTSDRRKAELIANQYVAGWKVLIHQAEGSQDLQLTKAIQWRIEIEKTHSQDKSDALLLGLLAEAEKIQDDSGFADAKEFFDVATGKQTPTSTSYAEWKAQLTIEPKTIDQMSRDVKLLTDYFSTIESITPDSVFKWVDVLVAEGKTISSRGRILKGCKNYWRYLKARKLISVASNPFDNLVVKLRGKASRKVKANSPYSPEQIVQLWDASQNQTRRGKPYQDQQLADLILISAYTGNRIEEVCSLKVIDTTDNSFKFIASKTEAGIREVPIHSKLLPTIKRLKEQSTDGYLMTELPSDKYGKRAGMLGKRFGILKTKLGFSSRVYTAHSFRSTLVTMLEVAGVSENLCADIVGHRKPRVTYGLYSGGATVEVMREGLEKVSYPFDTASKG